MANDTNEASKIKIRRDTTANWETKNPVLDEGEIGIEWTDADKKICNIKIGNGVDTWLRLKYFAGKDIPYSNIDITTLPKINGVQVKGNITLTELGVQPKGNYASTTYVDNNLLTKADIDDVYPKSEIIEKFNEYDESKVPSVVNNEGKYLKVINEDSELKMAWSDITGDIVTTDALEEKLDNYVEKQPGHSLVDNDDYQILKTTVDTIEGYNLPDVIDDVTLLQREMDTKVNIADLGEYIDKDKLAEILTGENDIPTICKDGYVSKEEFGEKADAVELSQHVESIYDRSKVSSTNPHGITLDMFGMNQTEYSKYFNPEDLPISNATQAALDNKRDNFSIGSGLNLENGVLYNSLPNRKANWAKSEEDDDGILNKPTNEQLQADWNEENEDEIGFIRNKPEIINYVLPVAEKEELGGIKLGEDFRVDDNGHLKYNRASVDYSTLENKPGFLVPARDEETGEIIPGSDNNKELIPGMIPSDYNLASLSVAKAIDDRLEEEKLDKSDNPSIIYGTDRLGNQTTYPYADLETIENLLNTIGDVDYIASYNNIDNVHTSVEDYVAEQIANKASIDDIEATTYTKDYLNDKFSVIDTRLNTLKDKENVCNKLLTDNIVDWQPETEYVENNIVRVEDELYKCNTDHTSEATWEDDSDNWDYFKKYYYTDRTLDTLTNDEYIIKYTSAGVVKEKFDTVIDDYNNLINEETTRATEAENAIVAEIRDGYYTKPEVDNLVSSVYKYKGTKEYYSQLPTENNVEGDVWNIINADPEHNIKAGDNVAWVGEKITPEEEVIPAHWDVLAGIIDLTNYYTKSEIDNTFVTTNNFNSAVSDINNDIEDLATSTDIKFNTKADKADTLAGYGITDAYTKVETDIKISDFKTKVAEQAEVDAITAPMVYQGTVDTYEDLPYPPDYDNFHNKGTVDTYEDLPTSDQEINDMYTINQTGAKYFWNGEEWEKIIDVNVYDLYVVLSTREYFAWNNEEWVKQPTLDDKADKLTTYTRTEADSHFATIAEMNLKADGVDLNNHKGNYFNPHQVTKAQVGLGYVENIAPNDMPISSATQTALDLKQNQLTPAQMSAVNSGITAEKVEAYDAISEVYEDIATKTEVNAVRTIAEEAMTTKADKATTYTKTEIDGKLSAAMHFKGTVTTVNDLPSSNQEIGDMYNVSQTGSNYAWDGNQWDKLSENIDLSVYYTKSEIDSKVSQLSTSISTGDDNLQAQINTKQETLVAGPNITITGNVISAVTSGTLATKLSELSNDVGFITSADVPDVNNGTLTILRNGTGIGQFSANTNENSSIDISVPTKVTDLDDAGNYTKTSDLALVALSNNFNDLNNKPSVNNGKLTIMVNEENKCEFTANSSENKTINLNIPTTVAELSDASDYATKLEATYTAGEGIDITNNVITNRNVSAEWGNIIGTLSQQTDLNTALTGLDTRINGKQDTLTPGSNITIENGVISSQKSTITFKDWTQE